MFVTDEVRTGRQPAFDERRVEGMVGELRSARKSLHEYQQRVDTLEQELVGLAGLKQEVAALKAGLDQVQPGNKHAGGRKQALETRPRNFGVPHVNDTYAFSAYANTEKYYTDSQNVLFNKAIYRYGNYYNTETAIYGCPVTGLYFFSVNVRLFVNATITSGDMSLLRNNDKMASVKLSIEDSSSEKRGHASNSVVFKCDLGDAVQVKVNDQAYVERTSSSGDRHYSTFSGFLIATSD